MKALFVTHSFPRLDGDAAGSFILRLAVGLAQQGVEVRVVAPSAPGLERSSVIQGIAIHRFRYAPRAYETLAYRGTMADDVAESTTAKAALGSFLIAETASVLSQVSAWKPDVIHAHWWFPNGVAASTASRLSGVPLVTTSHGTDLRLLKNRPVARPLARYVFRRSVRVTCVSEWLARQAAPLCRTAPIVVPMPVDVALFEPSNDRDANRIVFVGRLSAQKGIETAIRALALMKRSIVLDVIGDGPDRAALVDLAAQLGLSDQILWRGHVRHGEIPAFLSRSSALVAPFMDEGLGLVAAEAQLCETPPVGFASGGLTDVIENDVTGSLVAPGDVTALAAALERVVADPHLRERLGHAGRATALARFSPSTVSKQYAEIYRDAVGGGGGGGRGSDAK
ncbi:MAG TPA: glycosyltransferase [Gemmatimonadaceae bacterium]